jgi:hypothetical protein
MIAKFFPIQRLRILSIIVLGVFLLCQPSWAQNLNDVQAPTPQATTVQPHLVSPSADKTAESRAGAITSGITQITGLAINPLLVLIVIGVLDWQSLPEGATPLLHANPWFWGSLCALLAFSLGLRLLTPLIPGFGKLLKGVILVEQKIMGLLTAGLLIPTIALTMENTGLTSSDHAQVAVAGIFGTSGYVVAGLLIYSVVWVVSHVIDSLVLLSPFALIDATLLTMRGALLAILGVAYWIEPAISAGICCVLIVICFLIAGWCIRINILASTFAFDLLTLRCKWMRPNQWPIRVFITGKSGLAPTRTRGLLERDPDGLRVRWRRFYWLTKRSTVLHRGSAKLVRGVVWSELYAESSPKVLVTLILPPRYFNHDQWITEHLEIPAENGTIRRGVAGVVDFFRNIWSAGSKKHVKYNSQRELT